MSSSDPHVSPIPSTRKPRIPEAAKHKIIAASAAGVSQAVIAQHLDVHQSSVQRIVAQARDSISGAQDMAGWKARLSDVLPSKSVSAIEASLDDAENAPHAAAATGLKVLAGLGIIGAETSSQTINVFVSNQASLPHDVRELLCGTSDDVIDVTPVVTPDVTSGTQSESERYPRTARCDT